MEGPQWFRAGEWTIRRHTHGCHCINTPLPRLAILTSRMCPPSHPSVLPPPLGLQLFNLAMKASHECFKNIEINGVPKKVRVCMHNDGCMHALSERTGLLFTDCSYYISEAPVEQYQCVPDPIMYVLHDPSSPYYSRCCCCCCLQMQQGPNMWSVLRGSCQDGEIPTVTTEFDFEWPEVSGVACTLYDFKHARQ